MDDYLYALELNPARADVHDRLAVVAQKAGRSADAVREWKLALAALSQMMDRSRVPQKFWPDLSDTLRHIGEAHQLPAVRDDVEKILRTYIRRNGSFQIEEILESAFIASGDPAAGLNWIAELSRAAADPVQFLDALVDRSWVPDAHKNILYRQIVESAETRVAQSFGEQQFTAQNLLWTSETHWVAFLLTRRDVPTARLESRKSGKPKSWSWKSASPCAREHLSRNCRNIAIPYRSISCATPRTLCLRKARPCLRAACWNSFI
jgi:hypothetical protein